MLCCCVWLQAQGPQLSCRPGSQSQVLFVSPTSFAATSSSMRCLSCLSCSPRTSTRCTLLPSGSGALGCLKTWAAQQLQGCGTHQLLYLALLLPLQLLLPPRLGVLMALLVLVLLSVSAVVLAALWHQGLRQHLSRLMRKLLLRAIQQLLERACARQRLQKQRVCRKLVLTTATLLLPLQESGCSSRGRRCRRDMSSNSDSSSPKGSNGSRRLS